MKADKKEEVADSKLEVKALVEKYDSLEKQVAELKSLLEKKDEEKEEPNEESKEEVEAEAKAKVKKKLKEDSEKEEDEEDSEDEKKAEAKSLELEAKLKSIEAKQVEIDKVLNAPVFKARAEIMQKALSEEQSEKSERELKDRGPLDFLK